METNSTNDDAAHMTEWLVMIHFEAPVDLNVHRLLNEFASLIAENHGGQERDAVIGNLLGQAKGSLDDAFDAASGYLTTPLRSGASR